MTTSDGTLSWRELYEQRLDWAIQAGEEFLNDLESQLVREPARRRIQGKNRHEAVVLGESQVGKTRLILRMQGVREPSALDRIEDILRGESDHGNPSTATATTYSISPTDRFRIERPSDDEPEEMSKEEARARLKDVRHQMEAGRLDEGFSLKIELPRDWVSERRKDDNLNIVDLPGLDGLSEREKEYARGLASTYLHRAHLIMLVGKASEIPHLFDWIQSESEILPRAAWTHQESRFAVVLTHSATAHSRQRQLSEEDGPETKDEYRQLFEEDVREEESAWKGFEVAGKGKSISRLDLYPVELGDPDGPLRDEARRLVDCWTDGLVEGLVRRAREASSKMADLRFLIENYRGVKIHARSVIDKIENEIDKYKSKKKKIEREIKERKARLESLKDKMEKKKDKKESLPSVKELKREEIPEYLSQENSFDKIVATPDSLISYLRQEEGRMLSAVRSLADNLKERRQKGEMSSSNPTFSRSELVSMAEGVLSDYTGRLKSKFSSWTIVNRQIKHRRDAKEKVKYAAKKIISDLHDKIKKRNGSSTCRL